MSPQRDDDWTVLKLLDWTRGYLQRHDVEQPRLCAEILLAHAVGCSRIELYARHEYRPDEEQKGRFRQLIQRAAAQEPVAYLVGVKEFYSLPLEVNADVLIPRCESEILVDEALGHLTTFDPPRAVWDVATGSGAVACAIAKNAPSVTVLASDISPQAVEVARRNAAKLGLAVPGNAGARQRVRVDVADLLDVPNDWQAWVPVEVITANPPYVAVGEWVAECVKHEPDVALYGGEDGLDFVRRLLDDAPDRLVPGGALIMEFGFQHGQRVRELLEADERYNRARSRILTDHQDIERVVVAVTN
jgi:release factor glutamine methyltransferase